jgi:hypothetical protein
MVQLNPGLIEVGGQYIETYQRDSRASNEAKEALGLSTTDTLKANVGISAIEEYIFMFVKDIPAGEKAIFDLEQFNQPAQLIAAWIDDPGNDVIDLSLIKKNPEGLPFVFYKDRVSKNQTPLSIATIPLMPDVVVEIKAISAINQVIIVLKPVAVLAVVEGANSFLS